MKNIIVLLANEFNYRAIFDFSLEIYQDEYRLGDPCGVLITGDDGMEKRKEFLVGKKVIVFCFDDHEKIYPFKTVRLKKNSIHNMEERFIFPEIEKWLNESE